MKADARASFGSSGAAGRIGNSSRRSHEPVDHPPSHRRPNPEKGPRRPPRAGDDATRSRRCSCRFRKTTVLTQWANTAAVEVVWVSCRESSGQDLAFWHTLVAATALASPSFGGDARLILESSQPTERDLIGSLANDLGDRVEPIAIVIDDFHFAKLERGSLIGLAEAMPEGSRLILCSRPGPELFPRQASTRRRRVRGTCPRLAFTRAEQDELLSSAGIALDEDDLDRLYGLVEGWPAGTQLAAAALRRSGAPSRVIDSLSASSREVTTIWSMKCWSSWAKTSVTS